MEINELLQNDPELWDLFTRKEEYYSQIRDQYDRFPYYASSNRSIFEPRVSKYLIENGYQSEYPEDKPFAVCLTHDIDVLYKSIGMKAYEAIGKDHNARFSTYIDLFAQMRSNKLPFWNFSDIVALEDHYNAKSSFYFMVQDPSDQDYNYNIEDCETILGELSDKGWEVGLHGGHTAYKDPFLMKEKKKRLEKVLNKNVVGYRNHYLRFKVPETWEFLSDTGFLYDTTLGYNTCVGFRNGMCHPFRPFNLTKKSEIDIVEIPLAIMDNSLNKHMNLDLDAAWKITKQLIDTVDLYHGTLTILWHNTSFFGDQRKFYEKILMYCREKNAWMTSGEEIVKWVNK
jgi:hypothetical protein